MGVWVVLSRGVGVEGNTIVSNAGLPTKHVLVHYSIFGDALRRVP